MKKQGMHSIHKHLTTTQGKYIDYTVGDDWQGLGTILFYSGLGAVLASIGIYMAAVYLI